MDFTLTSDQEALVSAIERLAVRFAVKPTDFHGFALEAHELEQELVNGEYFDIATIPELGPVSAALVRSWIRSRNSSSRARPNISQ